MNNNYNTNYNDVVVVVVVVICTLDVKIPAPKDITDDQLDKLLESGDASHYRIPLSLGEPHPTPDNC